MDRRSLIKLGLTGLALGAVAGVLAGFLLRR